MGLGNVGQTFLRVAHEKKELCRIRYGLDIKFYSIFKLGGAIYFPQALNTYGILEKYSSLSMFRKNPLWKPALKLTSVLDSISLINNFAFYHGKRNAYDNPSKLTL